MKHFSKGAINAFSAGSRPGAKVNEYAVKVMQEIGIDISLAVPKGFNELPTAKFDYVVTLGCKDVCPFYPSDKYIEWDIEDPKGKDINFFRKTRDQIKDKVLKLISDIESGNNRR